MIVTSLVSTVTTNYKKLQLQPITESPGRDDWHHFSTGSYKLFPTEVNYEAAKNSCRNANARLVTEGIRNKVTRKSIMDEMILPAFNANKLGEGYGVWIGLDDLEVINKWKWIDGIASTNDNTAWAPSEPNNASERCGMLHKLLKWLINDEYCLVANAYVCEIAKSK
uniref:lectin-like n=1 Tax=Styela clava TaxID=7725 RepID=UPI001939E420|nr:lectin-like [Styela clava]